MKNIFFVLLYTVATLSFAQAQTSAIEKFYQKYENDEEFTVVYVSQHMFSLFSDLDLDDPEDQALVELLEDLKGLHILVTEKNVKSRYSEAIGLVKDPAYEVLMKVREERTRLQFFVKRQGNDIEELLLLVQDNDDEFVLISIVGKIDLSKISNLSEMMDIDGLEYLNRVENDK